MTKKPTREEVEDALRWYTIECERSNKPKLEGVLYAARAYLASLDAPEPSESGYDRFRPGEYLGSPEDATGEPQAPKVSPSYRHLIDWIARAYLNASVPEGGSPKDSTREPEPWPDNLRSYEPAPEDATKEPRYCTCPPGEGPVPCRHKYALSECWKAAKDGTREPFPYFVAMAGRDAPPVPEGFVQHGEVPQSIQDVYRAAQTSAQTQDLLGKLRAAQTRIKELKVENKRLRKKMEDMRYGVAKASRTLQGRAWEHQERAAAAEARVKELEAQVNGLVTELAMRRETAQARIAELEAEANRWWKLSEEQDALLNLATAKKDKP